MQRLFRRRSRLPLNPAGQLVAAVLQVDADELFDVRRERPRLRPHHEQRQAHSSPAAATAINQRVGPTDTVRPGPDTWAECYARFLAFAPEGGSHPASRCAPQSGSFLFRPEGNQLSGVSICLWQYSQSPLMVVPSFAALCVSSWHRKQPVDVTWPAVVGIDAEGDLHVGNTLRR